LDKAKGAYAPFFNVFVMFVDNQALLFVCALVHYNISGCEHTVAVRCLAYAHFQ